MLPDNAPQRDARHHRHNRTRTEQPQSLIAFTLRRNAYCQRGGNRPKHGVRQGDADAADEQDFETLGEIGNDVADGKEREEDE